MQTEKVHSFPKARTTQEAQAVLPRCKDRAKAKVAERKDTKHLHLGFNEIIIIFWGNNEQINN